MNSREDFDFIVVGAGLAGCVIAERIANVLNKKVLVIEQRDHIGGNCYDYKSKQGIIVHKYGPHLFRTDSKKVFDYLSNFTDWDIYFHRVKAFVDGIYVPVPFNFKSLELLFPPEFASRLREKLLSKYELNSRISILELLKSDDPDIQGFARFVYNKIYYSYSLKQWGVDPSTIDPEILSRVPVVVGYDDRYFAEKYQALPKDGYTKVFKRILKNKNIRVITNTHSKALLRVEINGQKIYFMGKDYRGKVVYTGLIDELFDYVFGRLKYRSLKFDFKVYKKSFFQDAAVVNYPNNFDFTRIAEFKHIHPVETPYTIVGFEYPVEYEGGMIPYYPVPTKEEIERYQKYLGLAQKFDNRLFLVGRLADYFNYSMGVLIERVLDLFEKVRGLT